MPNAIARRGVALALLLAAAAIVPAGAQPLYKWVDDNGKTQYSDRPPKGFKGQWSQRNFGYAVRSFRIGDPDDRI